MWPAHIEAVSIAHGCRTHCRTNVKIISDWG
jgi:hypothetical protein